MLEKLRNASKEFIEWKRKNCILDANCSKCVLRDYYCERFSERIWVENKRKFLNKKIEVSKINILTKKEKKYLSFVIKPFRDKIIFIRKSADDDDIKFEWLTFVLQDELFSLPTFKPNAMYKNMKIRKKYTLEELGL